MHVSEKALNKSRQQAYNVSKEVNGKRLAMLSPVPKDEFFNVLLQSYSTYFDIESNVLIGNIAYAATAAYHSRSEKYVLVKKAKLWAAETNEYVYFFVTTILDNALFLSLTENVIHATLKKIRPHNEHMCSHMSLLVIADQVDPSIYATIQQKKYRKNFLFSLHGWTSLRIVAIDVSKRCIITNKDGNEIKHRLKKLLHKYQIY